jgi:hypothetical protein
MTRFIVIVCKLSAERAQNKAACRWSRDRLSGARSANDRQAAPRTSADCPVWRLMPRAAWARDETSPGAEQAGQRPAERYVDPVTGCTYMLKMVVIHRRAQFTRRIVDGARCVQSIRSTRTALASFRSSPYPGLGRLSRRIGGLDPDQRRRKVE